MSIIEAIFLGILQGATEFLPVSSSGHLVLVPAIFDITAPDLTLIGLVHLGTLVAVLIYFRRDLWDIMVGVWRGLAERQPLGTTNARLGWFIVVGCIPAALAGFLLQDFFDGVFSHPNWAAFFLLVTAVLLVIGERMISGKKTFDTMNWLDTIVIGLFQMAALFPGWSRSGSTIAGGLLRGFDRPTAARYSFLLGVPVILGAGLLSLLDVLTAEVMMFSTAVYLSAFLAAAISGYLCIAFLLNWVRSHSLYIFAVYTAVLGTGYLLYSFLA
ncbi:MAG: undecaprenyl-diphosphate phosphatase [Chloroflexi bacterium]|nr:undecaprenyl-diphosphate phosphatase [Chloroflexota bacterium]MBK7179065.1 undecaprenyl-diphosphate phosphatase [Chloroflexota bacterium]MBK8933239.1 undecaprenyl-diphosphate phosphatase [Chloroflexota bacterium]MBP7593954.1 undecaprenyl-diphosphate phosphatase [Chloroflexota bacterium]